MDFYHFLLLSVTHMQIQWSIKSWRHQIKLNIGRDLNTHEWIQDKNDFFFMINIIRASFQVVLSAPRTIFSLTHSLITTQYFYLHFRLPYLALTHLVNSCRSGVSAGYCEKQTPREALSDKASDLRSQILWLTGDSW